MSAQAVESLKRLQHLLQQEQITWEEVEECASAIPGMNPAIENLRTLNTRFQQPFTLSDTPRVADFELPPMKRELLLEHIEPFVLFLDDALSMPERIERLLPLAQQNYPRKKNAMALYCEFFIKHPWQEVSEAATTVLQAYDAQGALLRGASSPAESSNELLRAAQAGTGATDSLLHPVEEEGGKEQPPAKSGWRERFFGKRKS